MAATDINIYGSSLLFVVVVLFVLRRRRRHLARQTKTGSTLSFFCSTNIYGPSSIHADDDNNNNNIRNLSLALDIKIIRVIAQWPIILFPR